MPFIQLHWLGQVTKLCREPGILTIVCMCSYNMPQTVDIGYAANDTRTWAQANTPSADHRQPLQLKGTGKVAGDPARLWSCLDGIWDILADGPALLQSNPKIMADVLRLLLVLWQVLNSRPLAATPFGRPFRRCGWSSPVSVL